MEDTLPPGFTRLLDEGWGRGGSAEERIFEVLLPILQRRAQSLLKRNSDISRRITADDLANTVYVRLRTTSDNNEGSLNYRDRHHFLRKAVTALGNALQDLVKRGGDSKPPEEFFIPLDDEIPGAEELSAPLMDVRRVLEELRTVNPRQADALELHVLWGFTFEESAALLDLGKATVTRDLRAAKDWLRDELVANGRHPQPPN